MFRVKYNQGSTKRRITIALALMAVMMCTTDVQLYCEQLILTNVATCTNKFDQHGNYFDMSLSELMKVVIVSKLAEQPGFYLLDFHSCHSDLV
jgi:hypothetical protein